MSDNPDNVQGGQEEARTARMQSQGGQSDQPPGGGSPTGQQGGQAYGRRRRGELGYGGGLLNFVGFGIVVYAFVGLGHFLTQFLTLSLAGDESLLPGVGGEEILFTAASGSYADIITFAPLLAVGVALYYRFVNDETRTTYIPATVATVAGAFVAIGLLVVLTLVVQPDGTDIALGSEAPGVLGALIGTALTAVIVSFVLDRWP